MANDIKGSIMPKGYIDCLKVYMQMMITKKKVALFESFKDAHSDVLLELYQGKDEDTIAAIKLVVENFCEMTDVEGWFNEL